MPGGDTARVWFPEMLDAATRVGNISMMGLDSFEAYWDALRHG